MRIQFALWGSCLIASLLGTSTHAATHAFVPLRPVAVKLDESPTLNWLRAGRGDDGYVRVIASIDLDAPCLPVGNGGWASTIGKEQIQLAVTVKLSGLPSPLADREVPIALVDGRDSPGGCIELNAPNVTVVPKTRLQRFEHGAADPMVVEVKVRTTSDAKLNLVSSAQAGLAIASLFASPAAAASVSTVSSLLAEPVLGRAESYMEKSMQGKVPAQASYKITLAEARKGVTEIPFAVHLGEYGFGTGKSWDEAVAIPAIQEEKRQSKEFPVFWVRFSIQYTRSVFPLSYKPDGTPVGSDIQDADILAYPNVDADDDFPSAYQWLSANNPRETSLLTLFAAAATPAEFQLTCEKALRILNVKGLNLLDRSIILRSFINVARGGSAWYGTPLSAACTQGNASVSATWNSVFGAKPPPPPPTNADTMQRPADQANYDQWLKRSVDLLSHLRTALRANENKDIYLLKATKNHDLTIIAPKGPEAWPEPDQQSTAKGWIARLSAKRLKAVGCFSYPYSDANFDPLTKAGSFLMLDEAGVIWVGRPEFSSSGTGGLGELEIFQLNKDWREWYDNLARFGLIGGSGDCKTIIPAMSSAPLSVTS